MPPPQQTARLPAAASLSRVVCRGHRLFRHRIVLSLISARPLRIEHIRPDDDEAPGVSDYEVAFLRVVESLCNGCSFRISHSGCTVDFTPGTIVGGSATAVLNTDQRSASYFLEPVMLLAAFAKRATTLVVHGPTSSPANTDPDVDTLRTTLVPLLARAGMDIRLAIKRRAFAPATTAPQSNPYGSTATGTVELTCAPLTLPLRDAALLAATAAEAPGRIARVRGIAKCARTSALVAKRLVNAARPILTRFIPDVYIYTDAGSLKSENAANSAGESDSQALQNTSSGKGRTTPSKPCAPGFGISLVAETTTGVVYGVDRTACAASGWVDPDEVGRMCALELLDAISGRASVDVSTEWVQLVLSVAACDSVAKLRVRAASTVRDVAETAGKAVERLENHASPYGCVSATTRAYLRELDNFLGVRFRITVEQDELFACNIVVLTSIGVGRFNVNKRVE